MTGYYDLILGLIPLSLIGIAAALSAVGFSMTTAIPVAATVPVGLIGHALFVNGPVDDTPAAPATQSATESPGFEAAD
ncbi:hypothetical protein [Halorussus amylolyticus]|uniref:hypothetical protein n=1 Tax=Halorussus amylolyticus TaxID=1126242 RepID=UPI001046146F|nr:hypothetical protein [Halorussus amylolyticus]